MPLTHSETPEELKEEFDQLEEQIEKEETDEKVAAIGAWSVSIITHILILLILMTIAWMTIDKPAHAPIRITHIDLPIDKPDPPKTPDLQEVTEIVVHTEEVTSEVTIITNIELEVVEITTENMETENEAKGREDAHSASEMGGSGVAAFMGAGSGASGAFGRAVGGNRQSMGRAFGPHARGVTNAIDNALRWLMIHQSPNGMWSSSDYYMNCNDGNQTEPGKRGEGFDVAMTGYALLCYLGSGYDHRTPNRYRRVVQNGIDWLLSVQEQSGLLGRRNYEHPVAAMALAEAYAMTNDPALRDPSQRAINIIRDRQVRHEGYPLGWDYVAPKIERMDISVSIWNIMALKSAQAGGLDIGDSMDGSRRFLEGAWRASNPNWRQLDQYGTSVFPYTWNGLTNATSRDHLSFAGATGAVFSGSQAGEVMLNTLSNDIDARWLPGNRWQSNMYALYYAALAQFQVGGEHWTRWREAYAPFLIQTQIQNEGCFTGTWRFAPQQWHGSDTSRILLHTYATLALQVAIRYEAVLRK
jgi:hypothetical protein